MSFDPKTDKYPYPEYTDEHYLKIKKNNGLVFDENYPYIDNSKSFRFKRFWVRVLLYLIVWPMTYIRLGLRIKGRKILKKYKKELSNGVISVSNHVHLWDYIAVTLALRPRKTNILSWANNVRGESAALVRLMGGIPIPDNNIMKGTIKYLEAIEKLLTEDKGWLHICAEGSMWEYYAPIRPFKRGAAVFAVKYNKPILPMAFSYRKPNWVRRVIFHQIACFNLRIGEPLYPNLKLSKGDQEEDLLKRAHESVCLLADINPAHNIYPPIFDKNKRVDYYTSAQDEINK